MKLRRSALTITLALALAAPSAASGEPQEVAFDDPCGDAAPFVTVAGQTVSPPARGGDGLDLQRAAFTVDGDTLTLRLTTCAPVEPESSFLALRAALGDGCYVELGIREEIRVAGGEPVRRGSVATLSRLCDESFWLVGTRTPQPAHDLGADAFTVDGRTLTIVVDRSTLPAGIAGIVAPGTRWTNVVAETGELGSSHPWTVIGGDETILALQSGRYDAAPGPAELVLG